MTPFMPMTELSIIVISYNTREMTLACLRSIYDQTTAAFEVIVVDNASSDGSATAIQDAFPLKTYPNLKLLRESENHGFARAHTVALPHTTAPWLLLLNPDTIVLDGAIDKLLAGARANPDAGIWGGRTLFADSTLNPASCMGRPTLFSLISRLFFFSNLFPASEWLNSEEIGKWPRDTVRDVDIIQGSFFLMRREDWDRLDGFHPDFFMYGEEVDLCLRAKQMGLQPKLIPSAEIVHYGGGSEPIRSDKMVRLLKARVEIIKRHVPQWQRKMACIAQALWPLSRAIAWRLIALTGRADASQKATIWREIWARRREWQNGHSSSPK